MADDPLLLYVRIRGRVQGPFDEEKLRSLVQRAQLSRANEVSRDGTDWRPASEFPEIFGPRQMPAELQSDSGNDDASSGTPEVESGDQPSSGGKWYYAEGDSQVGPVDEATVIQRVRSGKLKAEDLVWREGMHEWATVESFANLRDLVPAATESDATPADTTQLSGSVIRQFRDSRPWILFIAVTGFIYSALAVVLGFLSIIAGASKNDGSVVAGGLAYLLNGIVTTTGSLFLLNYYTKSGRLQQKRKERQLADAMHSLHRFWVFVGIVFIVMYVLSAILIILAIAFSSSLPRGLSP